MLDDYYQLYHQGCSLPLPIFPNTSYDWVKRGEREAAVTSAEKSWQSDWPGPDRSDKYIALAMRGVDQPPFENPAFEKFAQRLFSRLMQSSTKQ